MNHPPKYQTKHLITLLLLLLSIPLLTNCSEEDTPPWGTKLETPEEIASLISQRTGINSNLEISFNFSSCKDDVWDLELSQRFPSDEDLIDRMFIFYWNIEDATIGTPIELSKGEDRFGAPAWTEILTTEEFGIGCKTAMPVIALPIAKNGDIGEAVVFRQGSIFKSMGRYISGNYVEFTTNTDPNQEQISEIELHYLNLFRGEFKESTVKVSIDPDPNFTLSPQINGEKVEHQAWHAEFSRGEVANSILVFRATASNGLISITGTSGPENSSL